MKKTLVFGLVVALIVLMCASPTAPARAGSNAPENPHAIFLPSLKNGPASSVQLINEAVATGRISPETGLIYKVFATFSDPRLPGQYTGSGIGRAGDGIMAEVVAQARAKTLSTVALQTLTPFFVPPDHAGSWYANRAAAGAQSGAPAAAANWTGIKTANNKVWIIWDSTDAAAAALGPGLKAALDAKIWNNLTTLMGRSPTPDTSGYLRIYLWNSYVKNNGTVVPFDATTLGITVGTRCDQTPTIIYMPSNLSLGDETHEGLIQYATHEFMHSIQFAGTIQNCPSYSWLKEATATWAEDFVYKDANSEWGTAPDFLNHPDWALDSTGGLHAYGAYLLPYFLTHQIGDNTIIRKIWENAAAELNSYLAIKKALPSAYQDYYWTLFLQTLWNKAPFMEYFKTNDKLLSTVNPQSNQAISAAGGEQAIPLNGSFETGAAKFYHFTVDSSVRSLTILNGLGKKLSKGPATLVYTTDGDQMYQSEDLSDSEAAGATLVALMKIAGSDWQAVNLGGAFGQLESHSTCIDVQGKVEELVVIQSNGDFDHPNTRTLSPKGLPTTVFANNLPCWKVSVSSKMTVYNAGVTTVFSTQNAIYSYPSAIGDLFAQYPYLDNDFAYPSPELSLLSADVNWSISGTDSLGCVYSGSGSFHVSEQPGAGSESITIFNGVLKGSPTYRGYIGQGMPEEGEKITYSVSGKDCPGSETDDAFSFLEIPLGMDRAHIKAPAGGGVLSGSYQRDEPVGDYELMEWSLTPQTK